MKTTKLMLVVLFAAALCCAGTAWAAGDRLGPAAPDNIMPGGGGPALLPPPGGETEHYVNDATGNDATGDGTIGNPWKTIQYAVTNANAGARINVANGTYTEQVSITALGKDLTITGESEAGVIVEANAAIVNGQNTFTINDSGYDITIEKMTIRNGDYGIRSTAGNVNVLHCTLVHNGWDGTGVPGTPTQAAMATFWSTYATDGGAIRIENSGGSEIANCTVYENDRGIRYQDGANGNIHDNVLHDNIQSGIYLAASSYTGATGCSNTVVRNNQSYDNMEHGLLSIGGISNSFEDNNLHGNWNCGVMLWHVADNTILHNTINGNNIYAFNGAGNPADAKAAVYADGDTNDASATFVFKLCGNTITDNLNGSAGQAIGVRVDTPLPADGIEICGNVFSGHDIDVHVLSQAATTTVNHNSFNAGGIGIQNDDGGSTLDGENNWWGTLDGSLISGMVSGNVDYTPWLTTSRLSLACAGARLVETQNTDGGWDWPLDDGNPATGSAQNTIGPIGMGLAKAYRATGDAAMLTALGTVATFLQAKTNNFSPSDGYLAAELDSILGGTTNVDHVNTNFYGPLAAGTYDRNGLGTLYDTAGYVLLIRTSRANQGIPNLGAWDVGMGLVGASSCGADVTAWVAGTKAEIDELDGSADYDVIGLAGALYGLAFVGEEFNPTAGEHVAASNLSDLAAILAGYQLSTGGFTWNSLYMGEGEDNETIQETAYAVLALNEVGGYASEIVDAVQYMQSVQLCTGGWKNWAGGSENNEVSAEGAWGVSISNLLELNVTGPSLYVQVGDPVVIDMDALNLLQKVNACQAMLGYNSTYLSAGSVAAGGGAWDELIWQSWVVPGELDTAIGLDAQGAVGTDADGTVAVITLTAASEGTTQFVFRPNDDPDPLLLGSTFFSDMNADPVWPTKVDSQTVVIDSSAPSINIASAQQNPELLISLGSTTNAVQGVVNIAVTASDNGDAGLVGPPTVTVTPNGGSAEAAAYVNESPAGTFNYTWTVQSTTPNGTATIDAGVSDNSGNSASDSDTFNINKNQITGTVAMETSDGATVYLFDRDVVFKATDGGGAVLKTWTVTVSFTNDTGAQIASGSYALTDVPAATANLSAKTAWALRTRKVATLDGDGQATVDFTGGDKLRGGDIKESNSINILDYSVLRTNWNTANAVADVNGNGLVEIKDFMILVTYWFQPGDAE